MPAYPAPNVGSGRAMGVARDAEEGEWGRMALHEVLTAVDRIEQEALAAAVEGLAAELAEPGRRAVDALEAAAEAAGPSTSATASTVYGAARRSPRSASIRARVESSTRGAGEDMLPV